MDSDRAVQIKIINQYTRIPNDLRSREGILSIGDTPRNCDLIGGNRNDQTPITNGQTTYPIVVKKHPDDRIAYTKIENTGLNYVQRVLDNDMQLDGTIPQFTSIRVLNLNQTSSAKTASIIDRSSGLGIVSPSAISVPATAHSTAGISFPVNPEFGIVEGFPYYGNRFSGLVDSESMLFALTYRLIEPFLSFELAGSGDVYFPVSSGYQVDYVLLVPHSKTTNTLTGLTLYNNSIISSSAALKTYTTIVNTDASNSCNTNGTGYLHFTFNSSIPYTAIVHLKQNVSNRSSAVEEELERFEFGIRAKLEEVDLSQEEKNNILDKAINGYRESKQNGDAVKSGGVSGLNQYDDPEFANDMRQTVETYHQYGVITNGGFQTFQTYCDKTSDPFAVDQGRLFSETCDAVPVESCYFQETYNTFRKIALLKKIGIYNNTMKLENVIESYRQFSK